MKQPSHTALRKQIVILGLMTLLAVGMSVFQRYPQAVERYYSQAFYPLFAYLPKTAFAWLPFSFGDLFYAAAVGFLLFLMGRMIMSLFKCRYQRALSLGLSLVNLVLGLYVFFYVSWGMNYFRVSLVTQMNLGMDTIAKADYLRVLDKYVDRTNALRQQIDPAQLDRKAAKRELSAYMLQDDGQTDRQQDHALLVLNSYLSKTQSKVKGPLSSEIVSYFTVTGYFNPFTQEVQVNENIPIMGYPFTVVHELAHQMGVGFEDEANFVAYLKLREHSNTWYRYAASYETMQYLLRSLYFQDPELYKAYLDKISPQVLQDIQEEREFWRSYSGWINNITDIFYSGYLKHNNQPEGMERYSMMVRLVVAAELQQSSI